MRDFSPEEKQEMMTVTDLATSLSEGMETLTAMNLARPIKNYSAQQDDGLPEALIEVDAWVERFLAWQLERMTKPAHQALWSSEGAHHDALLYVRRKTWEHKVSEGTIINPVIRVLAVTTQLHRKYRADVHEAINHVAKNNRDIKRLKSDLADHLDEVVTARLRETSEQIAGAVLVALPEVKDLLLQRSLPRE